MPYDKSEGSAGRSLKDLPPEVLASILFNNPNLSVDGADPNRDIFAAAQAASRGNEKSPMPQRVAPQVTMEPKKSAKSVQREQVDSMDALFQQLLGMVGATSADVDYEQALRDSEAAIRAAYAGDIRAIRQGMGGAKRDNADARRNIEHAYRQLSKSYNKAGKRSTKENNRLARLMQGNSERSAAFLQKNANQQLDEQAALAKDLGIEDAMPAASEGVTKETANTVNQIVKAGARDANVQLGFAGNNQRYMQRGGQNALLEGTNRSADLLSQLQDYLQGARNQIAGLKGQRGRELAANESSVMSSVAEMQNAAEKDQWDRLMQLAGLKMNIEKEQFDQDSNLRDYQLKLLGEQNSPGEDNSMPGAENFANAQSYLGQLRKPNIGSEIFDQFLNSSPVTTGNYYDDKAKREFKMTPYAAMKMIEDQARQQGLSEQDIQLLRLAVFAQMG